MGSRRTFALSGNDKGEFFGTLTWGWNVDSGGTFSLDAVAVHDDITTSFGASLRKFIEKIGDKTAGTPSPATIGMPLDVCRELTATEKAKLGPFATFVKTTANARIWVVARYDDKGSGKEANHAMAMDNVRTVQSYLTGEGIAEDKVRIGAVQEATAADPTISPIEITMINT